MCVLCVCVCLYVCICACVRACVCLSARVCVSVVFYLCLVDGGVGIRSVCNASFPQCLGGFITICVCLCIK